MSADMTWRRIAKAHWRGVRVLSRYIPRLFTAITLHSLILALTPYITVYFSARIINELSGARDPHTLWLWVAITVATEALLALLGGVVGRWKESKWDLLYLSAQRLLTDNMLTMDFADADDQKTRDLLNRVHENMRAMGLGINHIPGLYQTVLSSVIGIVGAISLTWSLFALPVKDTAEGLRILNNPLCAAVMVAVLLAASLGSSRLSQKAQHIYNQHMDSVIAVNRFFGPFFNVMFEPSQAEEVRLYRQDGVIAHYLQKADAAFYGKNGMIRRLNQGKKGVLSAFSSGVSALLMGVVYAFAALKAIGGAFGVGSVTQYVGALTTLSGNVSQLFWSVEQLRVNTPYLETVYAFLDIEHRMYQGSLTTEKRADREYDVEFRNVSFRYPSSQTYALKNVSVTFRVGKRLAIVGENGSGKSTFIKLLCRLYDPDEGEILLNGINIRKYRYDDYLQIFSVVFQDFQLISQPLADNVAGSMRYDEERVTRSLEDAGFGERLQELENGLHTPLYRHFDKNGVMLSRGEAQKIAIARALYKNAPFMILDEPTAALDPLAEAEIYEGLDRIVGDRTAIYISHRLSSCRFCDEILVFDQGRIVERGTHDELVAKDGGKYRDLWYAQAQYYQTGPKGGDAP